MRIFDNGETYLMAPGTHFNLLLPDGRILNVEQTADDFSMVRATGIVAYNTPTSQSAKDSDGWDEAQPTTGRN